MRHSILTPALLLMLLSPALEAQTTRVLLVGDSWAEQQWDDQAHAMVFAANGHSHIAVDGTTTAISGSTAAEWNTPSQLQVIADALAAQPDIDTVQLTLGGNDFLDAWNANMTAQQAQQLQQQIVADLDAVVQFILDQRADMEVLLSFYDYPNFDDTLTGISAIFCLPLWNDMAQPTPSELNQAAIDFEQAYGEISAQRGRVRQVSHFGLMQFSYGFPDQGIQPGDLTPPGDLARPSPIEAMRLQLDCFHLRPAGYDVLVQNMFDRYYRARFDGIFRTAFD